MATVESLDDKVIIDQVLAARRESFESRRSKDGWARRAWDWYNNVHDFTDKEDWQTKLEDRLLCVPPYTKDLEARLSNYKWIKAEHIEAGLGNVTVHFWGWN